MLLATSNCRNSYQSPMQLVVPSDGPIPQARISGTTLSVHIGQPVVAALEAERQSFVVEAQQVHDRGLQIVDVDFVLDDAEAQFVGLAVVQAGFHAAAGEPHREAIRIVIAAEESGCSRCGLRGRECGRIRRRR